MKYMVEGFLADWLGVSLGQAKTLLALHEIPVMNYEIVRTLTLFPPSKMRERILDPLHEQGWIRYFRIPHQNPGDVGARRLAWCLDESRLSELNTAIQNAEEAAEKKFQAARLDSRNLSIALFGDTEDH